MDPCFFSTGIHSHHRLEMGIRAEVCPVSAPFDWFSFFLFNVLPFSANAIAFHFFELPPRTKTHTKLCSIASKNICVVALPVARCTLVDVDVDGSLLIIRVDSVALWEFFNERARAETRRAFHSAVVGAWES